MTATTTARDLEKLIKQHGHEWPADLKQLAHNALNALKHIDRPDNRDDREQAVHVAALAAFDAAYVAWRK